ncbi:hypothetical protein SAY86_030593 [Trapa natans]|uniref:Mechanosensitive ion channel protein n=1 Tax=Trapa natans TaxID=22666 RepID=A0AAN7M592_TRANT|nr:hypothetical protein SAY86_030593 [Trapa natans]
MRNSFKSQSGSDNTMHDRRLSSSSGGAPSTVRSTSSISHEEIPIRSDVHHETENQGHPPRPPSNASSPQVPQITRNCSSNSGSFSRERSLEFWRTSEESGGDTKPDPPSRLIGQFLHKQGESGGEVALDMDLEMDEVRSARSPSLTGPADESRRDYSNEPVGVSFNHLISGGNSTPANGEDSSRSSGGGREIMRSITRASTRRGPSIARAKTRSRLIDPKPEETIRKSGPMSGRVMWSDQMKSGALGKVGGGDEEEDPFFEEDLPDDYTKANLDTITLLQWISLVLIIALLIVTLSINHLKHKHWWELHLWKWEVVVLVLICGRLLSGWGIKIIVFFIERNFVLRKKLLYFVYGLRKAVQNCLWLGLVLIAWKLLLDKRVEKYTRKLRYVTRLLVCLLVGFILWLIKTLIIKVLASSFHVSTYFDRIQEALFSQFVIETLAGPPLIEQEEERNMAAEINTLQESGATVPIDLRSTAFPPTKSGRLWNTNTAKSRRLSPSQAPSTKVDDGITMDYLQRLNTKNVSAWKMKRLINIVRNGVLTTLGEQINNTTHDDESVHLIRSENEAKAAARKIFQNVAKPGAKYIYLGDLMRFMTEDEALRTMYLCEGSADNKRISKRCLKNWLITAFRDRKALALTLNDTKTVVRKLRHVVNVIVAIIIAVIWLIILGIATSRFLVFLSSELVLAAFIFGNTCKTIFESIIFLFVMHPFDVGDRCEIDGTQMIVEEMNILTTVFLRYDNQKIMYPNSILSQRPVGNFYRSPDMGDSIEFCVHIATPAEKIALMKQRIISYIESKKDHWCTLPMVILKDIEDLNRVRIAVWVCHRMNHQNVGEKWARRAILLEEIIKIVKELDIQYRLLPIDINVRSLPPATTSRLPPTWVGNN